MEVIKSELEEFLLRASTEGGKAIIYTIIRSVAKSGMSRVISFNYVEAKTNRILSLDYAIGQFLDYKPAKHEGLHIKGCGMDMGFHVVYTLAQELYGDGYKLVQRWL